LERRGIFEPIVSLADYPEWVGKKKRKNKRRRYMGTNLSLSMKRELWKIDRSKRKKAGTSFSGNEALDLKEKG